jgi:hypothetical protein
MDMACHHTPAIYLKALVQMAMFPAVQHDLPVFVPDEEVYPVDNRKTHEI